MKKKRVKKQVVQVAKRKRKGIRSYFGKKRRSSKSSAGSNPMDMILAGAVYGIVRPYAEGFMPSSISNFANGYGDELVLGGIGYFAAKGKLGSGKFIKNLGKAALVIEGARVASSMTSGITGSSKSSVYEYP